MSERNDRRRFLGRCAMTGASAAFVSLPRVLARAAEELAGKTKAADQYESYCGLKCTSECPNYKAAHGSDIASKEKIAQKWNKKYGTSYRAEDVCCDGCKADGCHGHWCANLCDLRQCAAKKKVETCAHCAEYPCDKFQGSSTWAKERLDAIRNSLR